MASSSLCPLASTSGAASSTGKEPNQTRSNELSRYSMSGAERWFGAKSSVCSKDEQNYDTRVITYSITT